MQLYYKVMSAIHWRENILFYVPGILPDFVNSSFKEIIIQWNEKCHVINSDL